MRLYIFTDASEEAMCFVAYLQDEATLKLAYVIGKSRVAAIRHTKIPKLELQAAVYGVRLRRQILREHDKTELTTFFIGPIHQQSYSGYSRLTRNSKCLLPTGQQKYWKTPPWINGDMSKASKTQQILAQEGCPSKVSSFRVVKRAGMAPDR